MATKPPPEIKIRNTKRAQWFFTFPVDAAAAEAARGPVVDGKPAGVIGLSVKGDICTLVLGDSGQTEPDPKILPECTIPGLVWAALMANKNNAATIRGLREKQEIVVTRTDLTVTA